MAGISPFTSTTPLKNAPYFSRIADTNLVDSNVNVNYPILAFKPGNALQASELNEVQENFYVQKTLSDKLLQNWWKTGTNISLTGNPVEVLYGPGWDGAVPVSPLQLAYYDSPPFFFYFTVGAGFGTRQWFLVTDPVTKFKFWSAIDVSGISSVFFVKNSLPPVSYIGMKIETSFVNCSGTETDPGFIFNDNSSGSYIANTCGASRFQLKLKSPVGFLTQTSLTSDFLPIIKIRKNADVASQNLILMQYMNNYLIYKESL